MNALLANKFLDQVSSEPVKSCLLYGTPIPCTGLLEGSGSADSADGSAINASLDFASADDDFYPHGEDKPLNDTNPLFSPTSGKPLPRTGSAKSPSAKHVQGQGQTADPFLVRDEPTTLTKVNVDLSLSAPWRSTYCKILGALGYPQHDAKACVAPTTTLAGVHTVGLGGAAVLLGVTGCFAGYAFYTRKRR